MRFKNIRAKRIKSVCQTVNHSYAPFPLANQFINPLIDILCRGISGSNALLKSTGYDMTFFYDLFDLLIEAVVRVTKRNGENTRFLSDHISTIFYLMFKFLRFFYLSHQILMTVPMITDFKTFSRQCTYLLPGNTSPCTRLLGLSFLQRSRDLPGNDKECSRYLQLLHDGSSNQILIAQSIIKCIAYSTGLGILKVSDSYLDRYVMNRFGCPYEETGNNQ